MHGLAPSDIKDRLQQSVNVGVARILSGDGVEQVTVEDLMGVMR